MQSGAWAVPASKDRKAAEKPLSSLLGSCSMCLMMQCSSGSGWPQMFWLHLTLPGHWPVCTEATSEIKFVSCPDNIAAKHALIGTSNGF